MKANEIFKVLQRCWRSLRTQFAWKTWPQPSCTQASVSSSVVQQIVHSSSAEGRRDSSSWHSSTRQGKHSSSPLTPLQRCPQAWIFLHLFMRSSSSSSESHFEDSSSKKAPMRMGSALKAPSIFAALGVCYSSSIWFLSATTRHCSFYSATTLQCSHYFSGSSIGI